MKINQRNYFHKWIANEVITEKKPEKKFRLGRDSNTSQICLAPNVWFRSSVGSSGQLESWRHGFEPRRSLNFPGFFSVTADDLQYTCENYFFACIKAL